MRRQDPGNPLGNCGAREFRDPGAGVLSISSDQKMKSVVWTDNGETPTSRIELEPKL